MNHLEKELSRIKKKVDEMWSLVEFQVLNGKEALIKSDKDLTRKIIKRGKKVNEYDVKIDRMCENFFALFNPVAVDLRLALAILKINANLERIGDSAEGIAYAIQETATPFDKELISATRVLEMYDAATLMLREVRDAFADGNTDVARNMFNRDELLNTIHRETDKIVIQYIKQHPESVDQCLKMSSIVRKLERIGDQITNISEEIIFYVDADIVKHKIKGKDKSKEKGNKEEEQE